MNVLNRLVECFPIKAYLNGYIDHRQSTSPRHDINDLCSWEDRTLKETVWLSSSEHFTFSQSFTHPHAAPNLYNCFIFLWNTKVMSSLKSKWIETKGCQKR